MTEVLTELGTQATEIAGNVSTAAIAGLGIGLVVFGIKKVWRTFRGM